MDYGLQGKIAVVTGGSDGIGRAAALQFAREGAKVAISARGKENLDKVAAEIRALGGEVLAVQADMGRPADIERFFDEIVQTFGGVDILLNNAGASRRGKFLDLDDQAWHDDMEVKVFGAIRCTRLAVPHMKKRGGGRVINVSIVSAKQPDAGSMPTSLSRAAGLVLTKSLSREFAPDNILVNAICLGKVKSGQHERQSAKVGMTPDQYYDKLSKAIPMGRVGEAEEAANAIVFLASSAASYITGTCINVDGGVSGTL